MKLVPLYLAFTLPFYTAGLAPVDSVDILIIPYPLYQHLSNSDPEFARFNNLSEFEFRRRVREEFLYTLGSELAKEGYSFRNLLWDTAKRAMYLWELIQKASDYSVTKGENEAIVVAGGLTVDSVMSVLRGTCPESGAGRSDSLWHTGVSIPQGVLQQVRQFVQSDVVLIFSEANLWTRYTRCVNRFSGPRYRIMAVHYTILDARTSEVLLERTVYAMALQENSSIYELPVLLYKPIAVVIKHDLSRFTAPARQVPAVPATTYPGKVPGPERKTSASSEDSMLPY